ncbi:hypothetical protein SAMN04487948_102493 [Halogranum amylolyticum]|uniref:Uncharacterized protein n=1 Tax=Halogranum amylolyticum TaxID=660520 RepID=A0A1H8PTX0_9EURY|nr:hypothetical protein [Halogranum amylolyticum]SEO45439.1 hypothetical protein SAMN04487948_102493 [Halogranum amylolyticum]
MADSSEVVSLLVVLEFVVVAVVVLFLVPLEAAAPFVPLLLFLLVVLYLYRS